MASYVIEAPEQGRILVVDKLDSSIHFKLTRAIADFTAQQGVRDTTDVMEKYRRVNESDSDDSVTGSSNFDRFIDFFEGEDGK